MSWTSATAQLADLQLVRGGEVLAAGAGAGAPILAGVALLGGALVLAWWSVRRLRLNVQRSQAAEGSLLARGFVVQRSLLSRRGDALLAMDHGGQVAFCELAKDGRCLTLRIASPGQSFAELYEEVSGALRILGLRGQLRGRAFALPISGAPRSVDHQDPRVLAFLQSWRDVLLGQAPTFEGGVPTDLLAQVSQAERLAAEPTALGEEPAPLPQMQVVREEPPGPRNQGEAKQPGPPKR